MYRGLRVAVVVPAYQEADQLPAVLRAIPDHADSVVVVDDGSADGTERSVLDRARDDDRIVLLRHERNLGPGAAVISGYRWALTRGFDAIAVIDGDGQIDPSLLPLVLDPIASGTADYAKGDRLSSADSRRHTPRLRLIGNLLLTALTRRLSGYAELSDSQNGFSAISARALRAFDWDLAHRGYGRPLQTLTWLGRAGFRLAQVPHPSRYGVGERSKMRLGRDVFVILGLLLRLLCSARERPEAARIIASDGPPTPAALTADGAFRP
ncbi:MAG: hypothetical protein MOGMAGMI_00782 [Candidatus Omnitrophica bacterium]|nr:hypothetical protein [Candidatus Omnitrophota bacterium]